MPYTQPKDDPEMRSEIDDLYEALFKTIALQQNHRVDVIINVLLRMTCAIAVEHGADKETLLGATGACYDATASAKSLYDKFDPPTHLQ